MNEVLSKRWRELRGLEIVSFGINSIKANEEDEAKIQKVQMGKTLSDPSLAMGTMADATSDSLRMAAQNEGGGGAAFGFMNMAGNAGAGMYQQMAQQQELMERRQRLMDHQQLEAEMARVKAEAERGVAAQAGSWTCPQCGTANLGKFCLNCGTKKPEPKPADTWDCDCGQTGNTGKFCMNCGKAKPEGKAPEAGWTCPKCGAVNQGKFCMECGTQKPADAPLFKCDKCGWQPPDPHHPPKFCPQCGDPFDEHDQQ